MNFNFFAQPDDAIFTSLSFLTPDELEKKRKVSKQFNILATSNHLWNAFLQKPFRVYDKNALVNAREKYIKREFDITEQIKNM